MFYVHYFMFTGFQNLLYIYYKHIQYKRNTKYSDSLALWTKSRKTASEPLRIYSTKFIFRALLLVRKCKLILISKSIPVGVLGLSGNR
jgi:hypothetical protein